MDNLEDDPWDIMMFQMDEAIPNVGAVLNIFDHNEKVVMMEFWWSWQVTSWDLLHENLMNVKHAQEFVQEPLMVVNDMFRNIDQNYPGHIMVTTILVHYPGFLCTFPGCVKCTFGE